jgi:hypothetical protein
MVTIAMRDGFAKAKVRDETISVASAMGLGRVKIPAFNLRVEVQSRFHKFETKSACDHYWKTIDKTILCALAPGTFFHSGGQKLI